MGGSSKETPAGLTPRLLKSYFDMLLLAVERSIVLREFSKLAFLLSGPILYLIGFRGILRTPVGGMYTGDGAELRATVYGVFKTAFAYQFGLQRLFPTQLSFGVVADVGANTGDFSLLIRRRSSRVLALEPSSFNFGMLCRNIALNNAANITPLRVAAHDSASAVNISGTNSDMYVTANKGTEIAQGLPLDSIIDDDTHIGLLKIDVQGHELRVLEGTKMLLKKRAVDYLIVEVHTKRGVSAAEVINFLNLYGYVPIYRDPYLFGQPHLYFANCERTSSA